MKVRRRLLVERLGERRVLAAITGAVFDDANHSLQKEAGEENVARRLVYIDVNDNATLDVGESFAVADENGGFEFQNIDDGTHLLRLFNGTQSQIQTVPVEATIDSATISVADALQLEVGDGVGLALTTDSLAIGDLASGDTQSLPVGSQLSRMQTLPDGTLLIVGADVDGDTSWIVDPITETVTPIDLSDGGQAIPWSDVAIDGNGKGVLLEQAAGMSAVRAIDASDSETGVVVTTTTTLVPADTQVLTSQSGVRSVFGLSDGGGLELRLWSNETNLFIGSRLPDSGLTGLLAFDDASGLLAVRTASGGVSVRDVSGADENGMFTELYAMSDATGPVAVDGVRDLLMTISPQEAMLKIINLRDGELIADLAIDLSEVGQVASLAMGNSADSVVVLGAAGALEVALRKPSAHEVTITGGQDADPVLFGVSLSGTNAAPAYTNVPNFVTNEDTPLTLPAPAALNVSADADGDDYVLVQRGQASNGTAIVRIDGSLSYVPNDDFNGTDSVLVLLHDGRDVSAEVTLDIIVNSVPDSPTGVNINIDPVPEGIDPGTVIGNITIIDVDGFGHTIFFNDPRFGNRGEEIIFVDGDLDFETEPVIPIVVTVTDTETDDVIEEHVSVTIRDGNDPITAITPTEAFVFENAPGDVVTELQVHDQDIEQFHTFTVDDERFIVEEFDLRLVDGVSVDFEIEEFILVNVTATEVGTGGTFTQEIRINVRDLPEQPQGLGLTNATVLELVPGAVVGDVTMDNRPPKSRYTLTVDDSRFEIDSNNTLKLMDDQFVERANQAQIQVSVTAKDSNNVFNPITEIFVIDVLENATPSHNHNNPYDVNHGGDVTAVDALAIINYLNTYGPGPVGEGDLGLCYDVNADGFVTALDALLVINEMQRQRNGGGTVGDGEKGEQEAGGEGEKMADASQSSETQSSESQSSESHSAESQSAESQSAEIQSAEIQSAEIQSAEIQPAEIQPAEIQPIGTSGQSHRIADNDDSRPRGFRSIEYTDGNSASPARKLSRMEPSDSPESDPIEVSARSVSKEFAAKVDETLRLLSEKTS